MSERSLGGHYRRLARLFLGRERDRGTLEELDDVERSFRHIWRFLMVTSSQTHPPKRKRPNVLVAQMGKVASISIQLALSESGAVNAFHSHNLALGSQEQTLRHMLTSEFTYRLSRELRYHVQNVALGMLVRWYQAHGPYQGKRLKLITLTRDPVTHYISSFIQRRKELVPKIAAWRRARPGADEQPDELQAVRDFVLELASIIADAGVEASEAPAALARARWPGQPFVAQEASSCLRSLTWLDAELRPTFGLDVLAEPELRRRGWVILQNDWAEVLALRFEQLASLTPKIAEFAGMGDLVLPRANVTSGKPGAAAYKAAILGALDTPVGQAYVRAVRGSGYARACGYDESAGTA
jgi:hypothetical protein